jgi:hypothetical protein
MIQNVIGDTDALEFYLAGPGNRGGRKKKMSCEEVNYMYDLFMDTDRKIRTITKLHREFNAEFYGIDNELDRPSLRTMYRVVHGLNLSRKVVERRHIRQDPI